MVSGQNFQGLLEIGQKVYWKVWDKPGVIFGITGTQRPGTVEHHGPVVFGGSAYVNVVFEDGTKAGHVPEGVIRSVQWKISEEKVTQGEIEYLLVNAEVQNRKEKEEQQKKAEEKEKARESLLAEYPNLDPVDPKKYDSLVKGSRNLKRELTAAFPDVKFSVRSESYSGGCSIWIHWDNGPEEKDVDQLAGKYQEGSFNGMEDIYEYNHENVWPDVFGGAKYVFCSRHETEKKPEEIRTESTSQKTLFD